MIRSPRALLVAISVALGVVAGCGGGDYVANEDTGPVRFYSASAVHGNGPLYFMSFRGGLIYGFYQADFLNTPFVYAYAGVIRASIADLQHPDTRLGTEFDFEKGVERPLTLSLRNVSEAFMEVRYEAAGREEVIAAYGADVPGKSDPSLLPGSYRMQARSVKGGAVDVPTSVDSVGRLAAVLSPDCSLSATLSGGDSGNVYDVEADFGTRCSLAQGALRGHGFQSRAPLRNLYMFLSGPSGSSLGVMLLLTPVRDGSTSNARAAAAGAPSTAAVSRPH